MNVYHHLHFIVASVGLDLAIMFCLTGLLTVIGGWFRWRRRQPQWIRLLSPLPLVVALLLMALGARQSWLAWSLLSQQEAISPSQARLLFSHTAWSMLRCLAVGLLGTVWLWWFSGRRSLLRTAAE